MNNVGDAYDTYKTEFNFRISDNVIPITLIAASAVTLPFAIIPSAVLAAGFGSAATVVAAAADVTLVSRVAIGAVGLASVVSSKNIINQLRSKPCVVEHGVYAGKDLFVEILGGPPLYEVVNEDGTITKEIDEDEMDIEFQLKFTDKMSTML